MDQKRTILHGIRGTLGTEREIERIRRAPMPRGDGKYA